jgi:DNA-binding SARP family transcriptional activator
MAKVTFRILGRLEVLVDGREVDLPSARERALLGALVLHLGEVVSVDALIDSVWGERAPASARHMVHEYVSRLRGALGDASAIVTRAPGYIVEREACDVDAARFTEYLQTARAAVVADELDEALKAFDQALGLWRGDALSDVALEADARWAAARLDDERRSADDDRDRAHRQDRARGCSKETPSALNCGLAAGAFSLVRPRVFNPSFGH